MKTKAKNEFPQFPGFPPYIGFHVGDKVVFKSIGHTIEESEAHVRAVEFYFPKMRGKVEIEAQVLHHNTPENMFKIKCAYPNHDLKTPGTQVVVKLQWIDSGIAGTDMTLYHDWLRRVVTDVQV
ncbi:MAG: hypothetical protein AB7E73_16910, partial [Burkholderiales bacterium]